MGIPQRLHKRDVIIRIKDSYIESLPQGLRERVLKVLGDMGPLATEELQSFLRPVLKGYSFAKLWRKMVQEEDIIVLQEPSNQRPRIFGLPKHRYTR